MMKMLIWLQILLTGCFQISQSWWEHSVVFLECATHYHIDHIQVCTLTCWFIFFPFNSGSNRDPASYCRGALLFVYGVLPDLLEMTLMQPPHGLCLDVEAWSAIGNAVQADPTVRTHTDAVPCSCFLPAPRVVTILSFVFSFDDLSSTRAGERCI